MIEYSSETDLLTVGFIKFADWTEEHHNENDIFDSVKILTENEFYNVFDSIVKNGGIPEKEIKDYNVTIGDYFNLSMDDMINILNDARNYDTSKVYIVEYFEIAQEDFDWTTESHEDWDKDGVEIIETIGG